MSNNVNSNPFAGLFSTVNDAVSFSSQHQILLDESRSSEKDSNISEEGLKEQQLQKFIADVFCITLQERIKFKHDKPLVYIETDSIEHAVFERLMLSDPVSKLVNGASKDDIIDQHIIEPSIIIYLFDSYCRLQAYERDNELVDSVAELRRIIFRNVGTALQEPDFYEDQEVCFSHNNFSIIG